ncbi:MAG: polyprenyl synthetase family protein [Gammaproteobacteria bacterium]|nr:MAG: Farnesyl diphosphate synthase [Oceanospirillaceae bacterium UBA2001]
MDFDSLDDFLNHSQNRVQQYLNTAISQRRASGVLSQAMAYSAVRGGKRVRAALVYGTARACGVDHASLDPLAAAVEAMHAYSLIHDDLPAMDDDALRRGQPSCHIAFDEATAILAGDALQALAFELLASAQGPHMSAQQCLAMVICLAQAAGAEGMVAGQMLDMAAAHDAVSLAQLERLHSLKTGALIVASIEIGALAQGQVSDEQRLHLRSYGQAIGLAFQVQDDILDIEGETATLGKAQGSDLMNDKSTYPALLGMTAAKQRLLELHQQAQESVAEFGAAAQPLVWLADFIVTRKH